MEKEVWKDVEGYEGIYQVSNLCRVKSLKRSGPGTGTSKDTIRKLRISRHGYYRVGLTKHSKTKWYLVHRLIAIAFIPNPKKHPCINHINSVRIDNSLSNLEWCTYSKNSKHSFDTNGRKNPLRKLTDDQVDEIRMLAKNYKRGMGKELAKKYNVSSTVIYYVIKNKFYVKNN